MVSAHLVVYFSSRIARIPASAVKRFIAPCFCKTPPRSMVKFSARAEIRDLSADQYSATVERSIDHGFQPFAVRIITQKILRDPTIAVFNPARAQP